MSFAKLISADKRQVSRSNMNKVIGNANRFDKIQFSGDFQTYNDQAGLLVGLHKPPEAEFNWRIKRDTKNSVIVSSGILEQNGLRISSSEVTLSGLSGIDKRYTVFFSTSSIGATKDPLIKPDKVKLYASATADGSDGTLYNGKRQVIGYVSTDAQGNIDRDGIEQAARGTIERFAIRPDGETIYGSNSPIRRTIEYNPESTVHEGELQLYDADLLSDGVAWFPVLKPSASDADLHWYNVDGDDSINTGQTSLQTESLGSLYDSVELYQFHAGTDSVPPAVSHVILRDNAATSSVIYSGKANFADWLEGSLVIDSSQIINTSDLEGVIHYKLDFQTAPSDGMGGQNRDHDFRYAILGEGSGNAFFQSIGGEDGKRDGAASWTSGTPVKLIDLHDGTSVVAHLLDSGGDVVIDWQDLDLRDSGASNFDSVRWGDRELVDDGGTLSARWDSVNRKLYNSTPVETVDWEAQQLLDTAGTATVEWNSHYLRDVAGDISVDWEAQFLQNAGAIMLAWDDTSFVEVGTAGTPKDMKCFGDYYQGVNQGHTGDHSWDDDAGVNHAVSVKGGIITSWVET